MKKVLIISDFSQKVGIGHFNRCNILAKKLRILFKVNFISSNKINDTRTVEKIKYFYIKNITHFKKINEFIYKNKYNFLIIDTYKDKSKFIKNINFPNKNIFCFDDFCSNQITTNLINQNPFFRKKDYVKNKYKIYAGEKYTLIGENFKKRNVSFKKLNFLISCGLFDQNNYLIKIINFLKILDNQINLKVFIALNKKANKFSFIKNMLLKYKNFKLISSKREYLQALNKCNISVTPIGVSVWERFYIGIPCMVFAKEKKEKIILKKLVENKAILKYYVYNNKKNLNYFKDLNKLKIILKKISKKNKKIFGKSVTNEYLRILFNKFR